MLQVLKRSPTAAAPTVGNRLVYAVGDVHGCIELLGPLVEAIRDDICASAPAEPPQIVFLGDYIDRGPYSRPVLDALIRLVAVRDCRVCCLRGNHEEMLLTFLEDPSVGPSWLQFGGGETLISYGVRPPSIAGDVDWAAVRDELVSALPPSHLEFLNGLPLSLEVGDYLFVHAGVRPGVPLARQSKDDLLWIRRDFLTSRRRLEKIIVHGHTPEPEVQRDQRRIGLDTGAYLTGRLSAIRLYRDEQRVMQIDSGGNASRNLERRRHG
jgi:serine/threonine protein phosphatase 1